MTPNFGRMVVLNTKKKSNEDPSFWSNGRAQRKIV